MALLTIRMKVVHDELDALVRLERAVPFKQAVMSRLGGRREEGVAAFGAEKVLLVVGAFAELVVFECDVVGVGDGGLAVVAPGGEVLRIAYIIH